jgi:hypothetical protein
MQKQIIFIVFLITAFSFNSNAERKLPIIVKLTSGEVLKGYLIEIKDSSIVFLKNKSNDNKEIQVIYRQIKKINFKLFNFCLFLQKSFANEIRVHPMSFLG